MKAILKTIALLLVITVGYSSYGSINNNSDFSLKPDQNLSLLSLKKFRHQFVSKNEKEKGVITLLIETDINASADKVWAVLGRQFADIAVWSTSISSSEKANSEDVPNHVIPASEAPVLGRKTFSKTIDAIEILTKYSDSNRTFTFQAVETPGFIAFARNNSAVTAIGPNKSKVSFDIKVQLNGGAKALKGLFKKKMQKTMAGVQNDLKVYVETGKTNVK